MATTDGARRSLTSRRRASASRTSRASRRSTAPRRSRAARGRDVWLKAENLQRTGSFKIRGAVNKLSTLGDERARRGRVAASAGNHGQAVAWAARRARHHGDDLHAAGRTDGEGRGDAQLRRARRCSQAPASTRRSQTALGARRGDGRDVRPRVRGRAGDRRARDDRARARRAAAGRRHVRASRSAAAGSPPGSRSRCASCGPGCARRRAGGQDGPGHDRRRHRRQVPGRADDGDPRRPASTTSCTSRTRRSARRSCCCSSARSSSSRARAQRASRRCSRARSAGTGDVCALLSGGNIDPTLLISVDAPRPDASRAATSSSARASPTARAS